MPDLARPVSVDEPCGDGPVLVVGTRKGLWRLSSDGQRRSWTMARYIVASDRALPTPPLDGFTAVSAAGESHSPGTR